MGSLHEVNAEPANESAVEERWAADLRQLVTGTPWMWRVLEAVRQVEPPNWVVGGGVIRNLVWDSIHGYSTPTPLRDVDVAYFDSSDWTHAAEDALEAELRQHCADFNWQVVNQAGVHTWYAAAFGYEISPVTSIDDAVARFPETCTSVAVSLSATGAVAVTAPHGLADLFNMVYRRNPRQVTYEMYLERLERKKIKSMWPRVRVVYEG